MIYEEKRDNARYGMIGLDLVCEYSHIQADCPAASDPLSPASIYREYHSALVHNISVGGICISAEDPGLDEGREIELFLTVTDPESRMENISLEFVARVVWISEDTNGFRSGLKFIEAPEDFPEIFERIVMLLEKNHPVG